jgi:hypothetical protein
MTPKNTPKDCFGDSKILRIRLFVCLFVSVQTKTLLTIKEVGLSPWRTASGHR